jgi:parallel beta-helix repeat protein
LPALVLAVGASAGCQSVPTSRPKTRASFKNAKLKKATLLDSNGYPVEEIKGVRARDILVSGNIFTDSAGYGISPDNSYRWTITGNTDTGRRKHRPSWAPFVQSAFAWQNGVCCATPGSNHKTGGYFTYTDNVINPAVSDHLSSGVRLDAGAHNTTFLRNEVSGHLFGIYWEAGANLNFAQENIVYDGQDVTIGASNFKSAGFLTAGTGRANGANNNTWINNVAYNNDSGFLIRQSANPTLKNNIAVNNVRVQILTMAAYTTGLIAQNNLWWKTGAVQGSTSINNWGCALVGGSDSACTNTTAADDTFNAWVTASSETGAVFGDPLFVHPDSTMFDFHLNAGSPAIAAGLLGVDLGAYPQGGATTPIVISIVQIVGGSTFQSGSTVDIVWNTNGVGDVTIELSRNSGASWEFITTETPNDGLYSWVATGAGFTNLIRITSLNDSNVTDTTDMAFTIFGIFRFAKAS